MPTIARPLSSSSAVTETASIESKVKDSSIVSKKKDRIKYFKVYRWDPAQKQKPYMVRCAILFFVSQLARFLCKYLLTQFFIVKLGHVPHQFE